MLRRNASSKWSLILNATGAISSFLVIVIGALLKLNPAEYGNSPTFQSGLLLSQSWAWLSIPVFAVSAALSQTIRSRIGSTNTWITVSYLLNQYRDALFEKHATAQDDPEYFHRITLFKYVGWRWAFAMWPWTGWMVPVARTGHVTHNWRIPRFRAPVSDPDKAEGVAGQTYVRNRMIPVAVLPEINAQTQDNELETYCRRAFVSDGWLKRRVHRKNPKAMPRSLLGIPLEVGGAPWGALVVDSRSPDEISSKRALKNDRYKTMTEVLSKLLQSPKQHRK
jgi:hypothetical protein